MEKTIIKTKWQKLKSQIDNRIKKMNRDGVKYDFEYTQSEAYFEVRKVSVVCEEDGLEIIKQVNFNIEVVDVQFFGIYPILNDWVAIGQLVKKDDCTNIFSFGPNELPESFRQHDMSVCGHCGFKRARNSVTMLENMKTKELKVVGSTCVKDFTGSDNAERLLDLACQIAMVDARPKDEDVSHFGQSMTYTVEFIECAAQAIIEKGYHSAQEENSTKSYALHIKKISEEAMALAKDAIARVKALTEEQLKNDFSFNMNQIVNVELLNNSQIGIAGFIPEYHRRELIKEAKLAAKLDGKANDHVGEIKKRQLFDLIYLDSKVFDNEWGETYYHIFQDLKGNAITWKGSTRFESKIGDTVKITGTVVKHDDYKGRKNTVINRCKVEV